MQALAAIEEAIEWLDDNQDADQDEYEEKLKELEDVTKPIVSAAYQAGGADSDDEEDLGNHDEL